MLKILFLIFPFLSFAGVDCVIFSYDRPLQLYACLESIERHCKGIDRLSVLYRCSNERFNAGYNTVQERFPKVRFLKQPARKPKRAFKPRVVRLALSSPSPYILFGVDDLIVKESVDLAACAELMEKTKSYGFFLRLGKNISFCYQMGKQQPVPVSRSIEPGVCSWSFSEGSCDWGFPHNLDMTLYRKSDLKNALRKKKYETPTSLEQALVTISLPYGTEGLYFEQSKVVNVPLNVVSPTGNPHMGFMTTEELLVLFEEGKKIDIEPFSQLVNNSPHFPKAPEFILR
jgi:hypothetical protein